VRDQRQPRVGDLYSSPSLLTVEAQSTPGTSPPSLPTVEALFISTHSLQRFSSAKRTALACRIVPKRRTAAYLHWSSAAQPRQFLPLALIGCRQDSAGTYRRYPRGPQGTWSSPCQHGGVLRHSQGIPLLHHLLPARAGSSLVSTPAAGTWARGPPSLVIRGSLLGSVGAVGAATAPRSATRLTPSRRLREQFFSSGFITCTTWFQRWVELYSNAGLTRFLPQQARQHADRHAPA